MEPYLRGVTSGPRSTTSDPEVPRVTTASPRKGTRRVAAPLGREARRRRTVTLHLQQRRGAVGWIEVRIGGRSERFFVQHTDWIGSILQKVFDGGYLCEPIDPKWAK